MGRDEAAGRSSSAANQYVSVTTSSLGYETFCLGIGGPISSILFFLFKEPFGIFLVS
jgi:hypothetical protein